jgi:hypothetical protein
MGFLGGVLVSSTPARNIKCVAAGFGHVKIFDGRTRELLESYFP